MASSSPGIDGVGKFLEEPTNADVSSEMSGLRLHYRQVTERMTRRSPLGLLVRLDPVRRAGPARLVVAVTVDEGAQVVGRGAVGSRRGGVLALAVRLGRTDGRPALEVPLRAAALDEHLAVGL